MRAAVLAVALAALAIATAARHDHDFEFDDQDGDGSRQRNYIHDSRRSLCAGVICGSHRACVVRGGRARCLPRPAPAPSTAPAVVDTMEDDDDIAREEEDVFYEGGDDLDNELDANVEPTRAHPERNRCAWCGAAREGGTLCGADGRTYASLCALDLRNCRAAPAPPVRPACAGNCPCRATEPAPAPETAVCEHDRLAERLLDWFSVLMEDAGEKPPPRAGFPRDCKPEVRWMFTHLDADGDGKLSAKNLYALRHDERERCLRPFLSRCAHGGRGLTRGAWCACVRGAARACRALARAHAAAGRAAAPACDAQGFYRPRQCHAALGLCWCVDAHGTELPGTRARGHVACPPRRAAPPDDDEDSAGSGDAPLRF